MTTGKSSIYVHSMYYDLTVKFSWKHGLSAKNTKRNNVLKTKCLSQIECFLQ